MKYIYTYFRDGKELSSEEWSQMLKIDLEIEQKSRDWDVASVVYCDIGNGRDVVVNGHYYEQRTDFLYDSAKKLFEDLMLEGHYNLIIDVLNEMDEEEIFTILSKSKCINVKENKKLLLKDEKNW